jgi:hypothetical protein
MCEPGGTLLTAHVWLSFFLARGGQDQERTIMESQGVPEEQPAMQQEAEPGMQQESKPAMQQEAEPGMQQESKPAMQQESKPGMQQESESG